MGHFKLLFPSNYLCGADLKGKDVALTIRHIVVEEIKTDRGSERKPVLYFVETQKAAAASKTEEKRLVLNKTNAVTIAAMYGNEVNDWAGKRIVLHGQVGEWFGKTTEAIRVRPYPPPAKAAVESPEPQPES